MMRGMEEVWRYIADWSPAYEVSNHGRVRRDGVNILGGAINSVGYAVVALSLSRARRKTHYVHRLVASAFIRPPLASEAVHHIDGNRLNNSLANLEIATWKELHRRTPRFSEPPRFTGTGSPPPDGFGEWRKIPGFDGRYFASSTGELWSAFDKHGRGRLLRQSSAQRYKSVGLTDPDGRKASHTVHSLIAATFLGPRPAGHYVCHGDDQPHNNAAENLRYDTAAGNSADAVRLGGMPRGVKTYNAVLTDSGVRVARDQYRSGMSVDDIAAAAGVSRSTAYNAIVGRTWGHLTGALEPHELRRYRPARAQGSHSNHSGSPF